MTPLLHRHTGVLRMPDRLWFYVVLATFWAAVIWVVR
jgi:hypothetical protein